MDIERLWELVPEHLAALIAESEASGLTFVRRLADEWASGFNRFDRPGEALFAARDAADVVGIGGLNIDPYAGDVSIGRVRHLYVRSAYRRRGIGERLVTVIVDAASGRFRMLRLSTFNVDAARLYERMGFHDPDGAPRCTHAMELAARLQRGRSDAGLTTS